MTRMLSSVLVFALAACPHRELPKSPRPPTTPTAITSINSPYDDFNAADMSFLHMHRLVFSTNRGSQGHDFDLYQATMGWSWVEESPPNGPTPFSTDVPQPFAPQLMSDGNERGPIELETGPGKSSLVFASDRAGGLGGLDLYAAACPGTGYSHDVPCARATELHLLTSLSSPADDAYVSMPFADHQLVFASNRDGHEMDIYSARWASDKTIEDVPEAIARVAALSSDADDTAPYVYGPSWGAPVELVFVSTRPGGLGEHDLYCSRFADGQWSAPTNLGAINSPRDEYRPIVIRVNNTQFLIFSSTRDGGQGGYDLYIVGYHGCPR